MKIAGLFIITDSALYITAFFILTETYMDIIQTVIIAVVEGITEYIPISSTGHMIITEKLLGIPDNEYTKMFTVAIQLGAILAVGGF